MRILFLGANCHRQCMAQETVYRGSTWRMFGFSYLFNLNQLKLCRDDRPLKEGVEMQLLKGVPKIFGGL